MLCSAIILVLPDTDRDPARIPILIAGHPPPLLDPRRKVEPIALQGPLLGAPDEHHWELSTMELSAGEQLVLYTDGVTEARGAGERFGEERLRLSLSSATGPRDVVRSVESALDSFIAGEPEDDAAVLAIYRSGGPAPRIEGAGEGADQEIDGSRKLGRVSAPREGVFRSPDGPGPRDPSGHPEPGPPSHDD